MPVNFGHKQGEIPLPASLKTVPWLDRPGTDPAPAASLFRAEVLFCSLFQEGGSSKLQPGSREKRTNIYSVAHRDADADECGASEWRTTGNAVEIIAEVGDNP